MSKRLQVLLEEEEFDEVRRAAHRRRMTVAEWVRQSLREARMEEPTTGVDEKLAILERAGSYNFPAVDIETMLSEIELGYLDPSL